MRTKTSKNKIMVIIVCLIALAAIITKTAFAANDSLSVVNISTSTKPGYAIYWPKDKGSAKVERAVEGSAFSLITTTDLNYYADFAVEKGVKYIYKVTYQGNSLVANSSDILEGKPVISAVKIGAGAVGKAEASVIVNFKTDRLAKSQVLYGTSLSYESQTELSEDLNQSHTILIEKLKPNTTYHFKIRATDHSGKDRAESEDQVFTTPASPPDTSLLQIILKALTQAFAGFEKWLRS